MSRTATPRNLTRAGRIAHFDDIYVDHLGGLHIRAGDATACGLPTHGSGRSIFDRHQNCGRCVEAVVQARRTVRYRDKADYAFYLCVIAPLILLGLVLSGCAIQSIAAGLGH